MKKFLALVAFTAIVGIGSVSAQSASKDNTVKPAAATEVKSEAKEKSCHGEAHKGASCCKDKSKAEASSKKASCCAKHEEKAEAKEEKNEKLN